MCETESSLSGEFVFHVWNQVGKKTFRRNKSLKEKNNWGVINVVIYTFSNLEKQIIFPLLWFTVRKKSRQTKKQTSPVRNTFELMSLHREAGTVTCVNNSHLASPLNHSTVWWTWVTRTLFTTNIQSGIWTHNLLHHKSLELEQLPYPLSYDQLAEQIVKTWKQTLLLFSCSNLWACFRKQVQQTLIFTLNWLSWLTLWSQTLSFQFQNSWSEFGESTLSMLTLSWARAWRLVKSRHHHQWSSDTVIHHGNGGENRKQIFSVKKSNTAAAVIKITDRVLDVVVFSFWV